MIKLTNCFGWTFAGQNYGFLVGKICTMGYGFLLWWVIKLDDNG